MIEFYFQFFLKNGMTNRSGKVLFQLSPPQTGDWDGEEKDLLTPMSESSDCIFPVPLKSNLGLFPKLKRYFLFLFWDSFLASLMFLPFFQFENKYQTKKIKKKRN